MKMEEITVRVLAIIAIIIGSSYIGYKAGAEIGYTEGRVEQAKRDMSIFDADNMRTYFHCMKEETAVEMKRFALWVIDQIKVE